jgi:pimeloyl-ACP methyl ester carboxylesterase
MDLTARIETAIGGVQYRLLTRGAARVLGFDDGAIDVDGVHVPFLARGWGVPIVLVHGFGADKESWLTMAASLPRKHATIIPDLPGFGVAGHIGPERAAAKHQAAVIAKLLDRLGYARAHLVGSSMGGGISLRFAQDFPARVTSLSLIGSVGPIVEKSELMLALDRGDNPLIIESAAEIDRMMHFVAEQVPRYPRTILRYVGERRAGLRDHFSALFRGWRDPNDGDGISEDLSTITAPALVIQGDRDRVIHPSTARALAEQLPNARLEMLAGIGHVPQMEAPRKTAQLVESFVAEVEARGVS